MPRVMRRPIAHGLLAALAATATAQEQPPAEIDFSAPRRDLALDRELREISGIAAVDQDTVACVQDEAGTVFFVDLPSGVVVRRVQFGPKGDYEELARAADGFWVLRSDGLLQRLAQAGRGYRVDRELRVGDAVTEYEALAYDSVTKAFLAVPKRAPEGWDKHERPVFTIEPSTGKRAPQPVFVLSRTRIVADAERHGITLPTREGKHGRERVELELRPSALAVQPTSGRLWVLSAADALLLVFERDGTLFAAHPLSRELLPQAEGITFLPKGDLVVSSEGRDGPARIVVFGCRASAATVEVPAK